MLEGVTHHHVRVDPVRVRQYDAQLGVDVSRIVGYRARCGCGWRGPKRDDVRATRDDGKAHRAAA